MRAPSIVVAVLVFAGALACGGTPDPAPVPTQPEPPPAAAPRVLPEGDIEPVEVVTLSFDGKCQVKLAKVPSGGEPRELGTITGPCPERALVTWKPGAVVLSDEAGVLTELGAKKNPPAMPSPPGAIAFSEAGALHACGPSEVVATEQDGKYVAEYKGEKLEIGKPAVADAAAVQLRWEIVGGKWVEKGFELVPHLIFPVPPDCMSVEGFPKAKTQEMPPFADSNRPDWFASAWTSATAEDSTPLKALKEGDWYVDATRTVASQGQPDSGPYAAFIGDSWKLVYPGEDARGIWLTDDFIGIRDSDNGFQLLSRRDGSVAFEQAEKTLSFPWPEGAGAKDPPDGDTPEGDEPATDKPSPDLPVYGADRGKKEKVKGKAR